MFEDAFYIHNRDTGSVYPCYLQGFNWLSSLGDKWNWLNAIMPRFLKASNVLMIGNPYLSDTKPAYGNKDKKLTKGLFKALRKSIENERGQKIDFILIKDIESEEDSGDFVTVQTEPLMSFDSSRFSNESDYLGAMQSKYRRNLKRQLKKGEPLTIKTPSPQDLQKNTGQYFDYYNKISESFGFSLYHINTEYLNNISQLDDFVVKEYWLDNRLVGYWTMLKEDKKLLTHIVGYDKSINTDYSIYLNLLYDMTIYGIENGFDTLNFGRTSTTIKSNLGQTGSPLFFGFYSFLFPNKLVKRIIKAFYPYKPSEIRNPFKKQ